MSRNSRGGIPVGTCACGKQSYENRKEARRAARRHHRGEPMSEFECDRHHGYWHIGHTPKEAIYGKESKRDAARKNGRRYVA